MQKIKFDLIIPIYNEGENLIELFKHLKRNVQSSFRILLCYDNENDDVERTNGNAKTRTSYENDATKKNKF